MWPTGQLATSDLGDCYKNVKESMKPHITDIMLYAPSGNTAQQFVGVPVMRDGKLMAIFALQVPVKNLDEIVASDLGMGKTGESYLVGEDHMLRNNSRLLTLEAKTDEEIFPS